MYDSVITQEDCDREQKRFLRSLGMRNMDELNKLMESCDFDAERVMKVLGVKG